MLLHECETIAEESRAQFPTFNRLTVPTSGMMHYSLLLSYLNGEVHGDATVNRSEMWQEARGIFNDLYDQRVIIFPQIKNFM